ncbi:MAG: hypothetical protein H7X70_01905 [Candidatus Kapabacteria bacterium]|nr:hypothetical protein [Candidatus Kapabacteria bacterium]
MHYLIAILIACLFGTACSGTDSCLKDVAAENFSVSISKGMCFGKCPVYKGTVWGDGRVTYEGQQNVERLGTFSGVISQEDLCKLVTQVRERKLVQLDTSYIDNVPDAPVTTITITDKGRSKTFSWNMGSPEPLRELGSRMVNATFENKKMKRQP